MILNVSDILSKFKIDKKHLKQPSRKSRVIEHKKQGTLSEGEGIPTTVEGSDGDVTIRNVLGKGLFKYTKYKGGWYSQKLEGNAQNSIINSNTTDDEILVYDESIQAFRNKIIKGDLTFGNGVLSLKNNIIGNQHLSENCIDTEQIKSGSISRTHIIDNTLELSKFRDVTTVLEKNTFAMTAGSALNVSGSANAVGIITFTGLPSTGTQASGTINITETKNVQSGSTLTIYDGNNDFTFIFLNSGENPSSNYNYKSVTIANTNVETISNLRTAILNATDLLNVTIYNSDLGLQIQNKVYSAIGNKSITQSSNVFTLTGMSSGADGGSFTIPNTDIIENKKFIFEPEITGTTKKSGNVFKVNESDEKIDYVTAKTDVTTTATTVKDYINNFRGTNNKGLGISASSSSGALTITQETLVGADGNGTIISNDANITVTQSMQGGVDKDAKYIIISRPLNGLTYTAADGTVYYDYVNTVVWFNVDNKLILNLRLESLRADTSVEVDILSTDANTAVATKTKTALDSFYCTDYKGDEYLPFTSTVASNNLSIECTKPGISSGFSVGTSGTSISNVATGKINLNNAVAAGDIDRVRFAADTGTHTISSGNADWNVSGGEGINTSIVNETITIAAEEASSINKGVAAFSTDNFDVSSGVVTIKNLGVETDELDNRAVTYAKMQNVTDARMLGNNSGSAASPTEMTQANVLSFLGVEAGATADQTKSDIDGLGITTVGTIDTGVWEGTAINQTYLVGQSGTNTGDQTKASFDLDHLFTLVGAASDDAEHLATFTGSTIADNQTIKQALQALETAVESVSGGASALNDLSDVTYSSGDLTIASLDKIIFGGAVDYDLSGNVTFTENGAAFSFLTLDYDAETIELKGNSGNTSLTAQIFSSSSRGRLKCDDILRLESGIVDVSNPNIEFGTAGGVFGWGIVGGSFLSYIEWNITSGTYKYMNSSDRDDYYQMTVGTHGATTLATVCDSGDNAANLTLDIDGDIELNADGGNITFKDASTSLAEISGSGILSKTVIYFDAETANTIGNGATGVIDWTVNQKQKVTITGTGITCNFTNPPGPCNLMLKVIQGDGSDVIGTWDTDIKWPSNTPPVLSTGNGAVDIISFYFDGTNYYGVGSLNFS